MVDIMPVVAAENAVPGKRRIAGLAEVGVLRAGIIPEDDVQGSLDVPGAIGALDDAALGDIGVALGVDAAACPVDRVAGVSGSPLGRLSRVGLLGCSLGRGRRFRRLLGHRSCLGLLSGGLAGAGAGRVACAAAVAAGGDLLHEEGVGGGDATGLAGRRDGGWPGWSAVMTPASSMVATLSSEEVQRTVLSAASSGRTVARRVQVIPRFRMPPSWSSVTLVGTMAAGVGSGVAVGAGVEVGAGAAVSGVASALREVSAGWGTAWAAVLQPARQKMAASRAAAKRIRTLRKVNISVSPLQVGCFAYTIPIGPAVGRVKENP